MPASATTSSKRMAAGPGTSIQYMAGRTDLWGWSYTGGSGFYGSSLVGGPAHVAPGSAGDWAVGVRSVASNRAIMSRKQFMTYSGIDLWNLSSEERFELAKSLSAAPSEKDLRDIANALGFTSLDKKGGWEIWHHAPRYLYEKDMMQGQSVLLGYGTISFSSASGIMIDPLWLWDGFGRQYGGTLSKQVQDGLLAINTAVGVVSAYTVVSGKYYKWNELWHKYKTPSSGTVWRWEKRWNNFGARAIRAKQIQTVANARALNGVLTKVGGGLIIADVVLSGELKPSHAINAFMLGVSTTGVGAIAAGVWFLADFGTVGVNYLIKGEAVGLSDMIDQSFGTIEMYEGLY